MHLYVYAGTSSQYGRWQSTTRMCRMADTATQARSDGGAASFEDSFWHHVGSACSPYQELVRGVGQHLLA